MCLSAGVTCWCKGRLFLFARECDLFERPCRAAVCVWAAIRFNDVLFARGRVCVDMVGRIKR